MTTTSEAISSKTLIKHQPISTTTPQNHTSTTLVNNTTPLGKTINTADHRDSVTFGNNHISMSKSTSGDVVAPHREFFTISKDVTLDAPKNVNSTASGSISGKEYVTNISSGNNSTVKDTETVLGNITLDDTYYIVCRNMATGEKNSDSTATSEVQFTPTIAREDVDNTPILKEIVPLSGDISNIASEEKLDSTVSGDAFSPLSIEDTAIPVTSLGCTADFVDTVGSKVASSLEDYTTDKGDITVVPEDVIKSAPPSSDPGEVVQASFKEMFPISSEAITVLSEGVTDNLSTVNVSTISNTFSTMFQLSSMVVAGNTVSDSEGNNAAVEGLCTIFGSGDRLIKGNKTECESRDIDCSSLITTITSPWGTHNASTQKNLNTSAVSVGTIQHVSTTGNGNTLAITLGENAPASGNIHTTHLETTPFNEPVIPGNVTSVAVARSPTPKNITIVPKWIQTTANVEITTDPGNASTIPGETTTILSSGDIMITAVPCKEAIIDSENSIAMTPSSITGFGNPKDTQYVTPTGAEDSTTREGPTAVVPGSGDQNIAHGKESRIITGEILSNILKKPCEETIPIASFQESTANFFPVHAKATDIQGNTFSNRTEKVVSCGSYVGPEGVVGITSDNNTGDKSTVVSFGESTDTSASGENVATSDPNYVTAIISNQDTFGTSSQREFGEPPETIARKTSTAFRDSTTIPGDSPTADATDTIPKDNVASVIARGTTTRNSISVSEDCNTIASSGAFLSPPQKTSATASKEGTATICGAVTQSIVPREKPTTHEENTCASTITHSFSSTFENTTFISLTSGYSTSSMGENITSTGSTSVVGELPSIITEKSTILNGTTTDFLSEDSESPIVLGDAMDSHNFTPINTPEIITSISDSGEAHHTITSVHGDTDTTAHEKSLTLVHSSITHVTEPKGTMSSLEERHTFIETASSAVIIGIQASTNDGGNASLEEPIPAVLTPTSSDDIIPGVFSFSKGKPILDSTSTYGDICNETIEPGIRSCTTSTHNTTQGRDMSVVPLDSKTPSEVVELVPGGYVTLNSGPAANISLLSKEISADGQDNATSTNISDFTCINIANSGGISTDPAVSPRSASAAVSVPCDTTTSALGETASTEESISSGKIKSLITPLEETSTQPGSNSLTEAFTSTVSLSNLATIIHGDTELITSNLDTVSTLGDTSRIPGSNIAFGNSMASTKCLQGTNMPIATEDTIRPGAMTSSGISQDNSIITFGLADETTPETNINVPRGNIAINAAKCSPSLSGASVMSVGDNTLGTTVDKCIHTTIKPSGDITTSAGDCISDLGDNVTDADILRDTTTTMVLEDVHTITVEDDTTSPQNRIIFRKVTGSVTCGETVMSGQMTTAIPEDTDQNEITAFKTITFPGESSKTTVNFMPGVNHVDRNASNATSRSSTVDKEAILILTDAATPVTEAGETVNFHMHTSSPQKSTDVSSSPTSLEDSILEISTDSRQIISPPSIVISGPYSGDTIKEASIIRTEDCIAEAQTPETTTSPEEICIPFTIIASEEVNPIAVTSDSQQTLISSIISGKDTTTEATTALGEITLPEVVTPAEETFAYKGATTFIEAPISRSVSDPSIASSYEVIISPSGISIPDTTFSSRGTAVSQNISSNKCVSPENTTAITTNSTSFTGDILPMDSYKPDEADTSGKVKIKFCSEPLKPNAITTSAEDFIFEDIATNVSGDSNTPYIPENADITDAEDATIVSGNNSTAPENPLNNTTLGKFNYHPIRDSPNNMQEVLNITAGKMSTAETKESDTNMREKSVSTPRQIKSASEDNLITAKEEGAIATYSKITDDSMEIPVVTGETSASVSGEQSAAPQRIPTAISEQTNIAILGETTIPTSRGVSVALGEIIAISPGERPETDDAIRDVSTSMGQQEATTSTVEDASTASENILIGTPRKVVFSCSVAIPMSEYDVTIIIHRKTSKTLNIARSGAYPAVCPEETPTTVSAKATTILQEASPAVTRRNIPIAQTSNETSKVVSKEITSVFKVKNDTGNPVASPPYWFVLFFGIFLLIVLAVVGLCMVI